MSTRTIFGAVTLGVALAVAACSGSPDPTDTEPAGDDDCLVEGTCSPGPDLSGDPGGYVAEGSYAGLPVGFTPEGYPFIGDPDAPVTVVEFSDFVCPFCGRHARETTPELLQDYGAAGSVNFVFRDFPLAGLHPTAPTAHNASLCVAEQGATVYWQYHDLLFANQQQWVNFPDPGGYLAQSAQQIGVDMAAYQECIDSGRTASVVGRRVTDGQAIGFSGTPSFQLVVNGTGESYDLVGAPELTTFRATLDALLAGDELPGLTPSPNVTLDQEPRTFAADPANQDEYQGLPVGFTPDGLAFIGNADAPVTLTEYSDYLCPFCFRHTTQTTPQLLADYAQVGEVNFVFHDFPLAGLHPTAPQGHAASLCIAEQGAAFFWAYHDSLFFNQEDWANSPDPGEFLSRTADTVGADLGAFEECVASGRTTALVDERVAAGFAAGFDGTPSFQLARNDTGDTFDLVGARPLEDFREMLDALIAGEDPPSGASSPSSALPAWASPEGLAPDPDRPGFTMAGDAFRGNPDAALVVVEFSDFQCPACALHALETQPVIDETFVDNGQVMWVFKNFPLQIHPQAPAAAVAAECAGEQGRFFEMHDLLFETQADWSIADPDPVFRDLGSQLGLDDAVFDACLGSRQALERVLVDLFDGGGSVATTPTFFFIIGGSGNRLEGARSAEDFAAIVQAQIDAAGGSNTESQ